MLLTAAALDLTRCGLVMAAARHPAPTAGLVTAGLAAAALTARTARGCQAGQHWAGWAALLIGVASAPQAAASGFRSPYLIPDTTTAALGILLAITILATVGRMDRRDTAPEIPPATATGEPRGDPERSGACASPPPARRYRERPVSRHSTRTVHRHRASARVTQPAGPSGPGESWARAVIGRPPGTNVIGGGSSAGSCTTSEGARPAGAADAFPHSPLPTACTS